MASINDLNKKLEALLQQQQGRRTTSNRSREEAQKLDQIEIDNLKTQIKLLEDKNKAQEKYSNELKSIRAKELSFEKQILKDKNNLNLTVAKAIGLYKDSARAQVQAKRLELIEDEESTKEQRKSLNELEQIQQEIQQGFIDGIDQRIKKQEILDRLTEDQQKELGEMFGEEKFEKILKLMEENAENSGTFSGFLSNATDSVKSMLGPFAGIAALSAFLVAEFLDFGKRVLTTRKELGLTLSTTTKLAAQQKILGYEAKLFDMTADDIATIQKEILNNLGGQTKLTTELVRDFVRLEGTLGISSANASKLVPIFDALGAAGERGAIAQIKSLGALAQQEGVAPGQVFEEIAQNAEFFAKFSKDGGDNLFKAAIEAKKLGLSFDNIVKATDALLDFETSIEKQLEASLLIGREINADRARALAFSGDQVALAQEIRNIVGTEADFLEMNVLARQSIADLLGQSVEDIARIARGEEMSAAGAAVGAQTQIVSDPELLSTNRQIARNTRPLLDS